MWAPPIQPNGHLESYFLALPEPRFEVTNTSQLSLVVNDLIPYTSYSVTVTACSGMCLYNMNKINVPRYFGLDELFPQSVLYVYIRPLLYEPVLINNLELKHKVVEGIILLFTVVLY